MTQLKMLSADDKLTEIRRLYFKARKQTIEQDLAKALDLLKSMDTEDERERATVYMEGLAEMRNDWSREQTAKKRPGGARGSAGKGGAPKNAKPAGKPGEKKKAAPKKAEARRSAPPASERKR